MSDDARARFEEAHRLRDRIRMNDAKIEILENCKRQTEQGLTKFVEDLARAGYSETEIRQALDVHRPTFEAAVQHALRTVTILDLIGGAHGG